MMFQDYWLLFIFSRTLEGPLLTFPCFSAPLAFRWHFHSIRETFFLCHTESCSFYKLLHQQLVLQSLQSLRILFLKLLIPSLHLMHFPTLLEFTIVTKSWILPILMHCILFPKIFLYSLLPLIAFSSAFQPQLHCHNFTTLVLAFFLNK